jgi:hypothetical protein
MSIIVAIRPLLKIVVVAGIAIGSLSVAYAAPNACALLTVAQVSAAVGSPVSSPSPTLGVDGFVGCMYGYGTGINIGVELYQFSSAAEAQKKFSDELHGGEDTRHYKRTVESGVGEGAFSRVSISGGTFKWATLEALQGSRIVRIGALSKPAVPLDRLRALMLTALAR